ncbi:integral membrane sensor signal transduction histidine kinase [Leadbetterella byssophila DSM 17132]|uniref:histidine kinase n=1 Tax=Leadbetterella byssophila (strain DSM 17132 / JCM 16389 / KACC 11308 / NBRC 106382 / 4M15) TaxID=649349 RepID=E4RRG2_LEAB4|nr:HAMP domain-containing sensor histidine kinase [Leadbetterella byssophila]ADQ18495.1 integral membrane sensor signal transduction histidine kinase [Leadbetterella byssophila DSM 17132]
MKQNTTALLLMVASVLLLATSQWFWLRSEYKEHKRAFYSNTDLLFKETVRTIEDSLVSKMLARELFARSDEKKENTKTVTSVGKKSIVKKKNSNEVIVDGRSALAKKDASNSGGVVTSIFGGRSALAKKDASNVVTVIGRKSTRASAFPPSNYPDSIDFSAERVMVFTAKDSSDATLMSDSGVIKLMLKTRNQEDTLNRLKRVIAQLPRMSLHIQEEPPKIEVQGRRRFSFQSAPLDSVEKKFKRRAEEMGYSLHFTIKKDSIPTDTSESGFRRNLRSYSQMQRRLMSASDSVVINGVHVLNPESITSFSLIPTVIFKAYPEDLNHYLMGKLKKNLLFSLFLLLVTLLAFSLIYRSLRKQEKLNTLKNDLISNITHELKTPLATLSVALEALQQFGAHANPQTTKEYLEISQNEVNRLSLMVDNILKTSLLEKQSVKLYPVNLDMESVCQDAVRSWLPRFQQKNGLITLDVRGGDFEMEADEVQLNSILNNLFDNALKYSAKDPEVKVTLESDIHSITVKVKDNGIGIPKEYQSQVFDKFFRVPSGDHHNVKGYGLGLNYVRHIMDLHHGLVNLESGNNGTTFILTFKRKL